LIVGVAVFNRDADGFSEADGVFDLAGPGKSLVGGIEDFAWFKLD
jgi:hypothetical protein